MSVFRRFKVVHVFLHSFTSESRTWIAKKIAFGSPCTIFYLFSAVLLFSVDLFWGNKNMVRP